MCINDYNQPTMKKHDWGVNCDKVFFTCNPVSAGGGSSCLNDTMMFAIWTSPKNIKSTESYERTRMFNLHTHTHTLSPSQSHKLEGKFPWIASDAAKKKKKIQQMKYLLQCSLLWYGILKDVTEWFWMAVLLFFSMMCFYLSLFATVLVITSFLAKVFLFYLQL